MSNIDWHAGFVSAMKLELMADEKNLEFHEEQFLDERKQRFDLLIVKKRRNVRIRNEIGEIFNKFNIIEYKNPNDTLDIGELHKVLSYTSRYLYERHDYDEYAVDAYTMTLIRDTMPEKLFRQLAGSDMKCTETHPGIYEVTNKLPFRTQIIVTGHLSEDGHAWLKGLTKDGTKEKVQGIIDQTYALDAKHKPLAETVMNVFTGANMVLMHEIKKEESTMCQAVNELFADEIAELKIQLNEREQALIKQRIEMEAEKNALLDEKTAQIAYLQAELQKYKSSPTGH